MDEIRNKVAESGLIQLDLADFKPKQKLISIDIADQLWQGFVLKEKGFRQWIKENDWSKFSNQAVCIFCSADAIIPTWAYMLVAAALEPFATDIVAGNLQELEKEVIRKNIAALDVSSFQDGKMIVKGCSDIAFPEYAMICLLNKLQPVVQSIMYGEPCSTVPIYKRAKQKN